MLILEIALGIILARLVIAVAPFLADGILTRLSKPLFPPIWRNPAAKRHGPNPFWVATIIVGAGHLLIVLGALLGV
jgi:hypothetical protein